jgi:bacillithiol system protein YtxJ
VRLIPRNDRLHRIVRDVISVFPKHYFSNQSKLGARIEKMNYQEVTSTAVLAEMMKLSEQQPVLFFKHSQTCGISQRAFGEFERYLQSPESGLVRNCVIVVQTAREVSNELARLVSIHHESPQAILVHGGRAIWNESHMALKSRVLAAAVSQK